MSRMQKRRKHRRGLGLEWGYFVIAGRSCCGFPSQINYNVLRVRTLKHGIQIGVDRVEWIQEQRNDTRSALPRPTQPIPWYCGGRMSSGSVSQYPMNLPIIHATTREDDFRLRLDRSAPRPHLQALARYSLLRDLALFQSVMLLHPRFTPIGVLRVVILDARD